MDRALFYDQLLNFTNNPLSINLIVSQFIIVSLLLALVFSIDTMSSELENTLTSLCRLHIKLFTLYGLLGTVLGMVNLFYTASIDLDSRWMALGLANTIKPSLLGMICSIFTSIFYYIYLQREQDET